MATENKQKPKATKPTVTKPNPKTSTSSSKASKKPQIGPQQGVNNKELGMPEPPKDAFFRGDHALIRFNEDPGPGDTSTVWLVDVKKKVLRPFLDEQAFTAYFGGTTIEEQDEKGAISSVDLSDLGGQGTLRNFRMLQDADGVGGDGNIPITLGDDIDEAKFDNKYGKQGNPEGEEKAGQVLDGILTQIKQMPNVGIKPQFIDRIAKDDKIISFYLNALTYGGYSPLDVMKDLKRRSHMERTPNRAIQ